MINMFFARYRRPISLVIIVILALIIYSIYTDITKSWLDRLLDSEEKIKSGDSEFTFNTYISYLNSLSNNQKIEYLLFDINNDGKNEVFIKYYDKEEIKFVVISNENKTMIYELSKEADMTTLREDGIFKLGNYAYAYITLTNGKIYSNLLLHRSEESYYYKNEVITVKEYETYLKDHLKYDLVKWSSSIR